jgi:hypothetical protein
MVWSRATTPARAAGVWGGVGTVGTVRHAGCCRLGADNFRKDSTMRLMQQTFLMTDLRKRLVLLSLLSFVALC